MCGCEVCCCRGRQFLGTQDMIVYLQRRVHEARCCGAHHTRAERTGTREVSPGAAESGWVSLLDLQPRCDPPPPQVAAPGPGPVTGRIVMVSGLLVMMGDVRDPHPKRPLPAPALPETARRPAGQTRVSEGGKRQPRRVPRLEERAQEASRGKSVSEVYRDSQERAREASRRGSVNEA
ncbi:hypothetical protein NDU88_006557 [Pleurodeles waltl]|uniref:Uncharacterized protein n=1 Tax=Pleurodeles waltl TaxID=8319 RepID=A0AAV7SQ01_PLEWA|nr:hypothetical protein NDU88_006557 [Pleurodeles waltl]